MKDFEQFYQDLEENVFGYKYDYGKQVTLKEITRKETYKKINAICKMIISLNEPGDMTKIAKKLSSSHGVYNNAEDIVGDFKDMMDEFEKTVRVKYVKTLTNNVVTKVNYRGAHS